MAYQGKRAYADVERAYLAVVSGRHVKTNQTEYNSCKRRYPRNEVDLPEGVDQSSGPRIKQIAHQYGPKLTNGRGDASG